MMNAIALFCPRVLRRCSYAFYISRSLCDCREETHNGFEFVEDALKKSWRTAGDEDDEKPVAYVHRSRGKWGFSSRRRFIQSARIDARRVLETLQQDGPGFDTKAALSELGIRISGILVREVMIGILKILDCTNKCRCARLGYKFFVWSGQQKSYDHNVESYHWLMKIFAECQEYKAMWRLAYEMTEKGLPTTARTFKILICTCGEAGMAKKVVERFIKSKNFSYRPFKHSYNAILYSLLVIKQYKLIEWVYERMLDAGYSPDILTYNIIMCAKIRLRKLYQFHKFVDEMGKSGLSPDFHTFGILLHVLGKGDKPLAAVNLLNHMREVGCEPNVLHFTTLMDGLSRAGNLEACQYFFGEMKKIGCMPDVVCFTVLIAGYVAAGELEKAQGLFDEMVLWGLVPNVFTYNSIIRGLCMAGRFDEACSMLKEMEQRGCNPNFFVYRTLVEHLRSAGKLSEAHEVIRNMVEKGKYVHLIARIRQYTRC